MNFKFELDAFVTPIVESDYHARAKLVILERWDCEDSHGHYAQYLCGHYALGDYKISVFLENSLATYEQVKS